MGEELLLLGMIHYRLLSPSNPGLASVSSVPLAMIPPMAGIIR